MGAPRPAPDDILVMLRKAQRGGVAADLLAVAEDSQHLVLGEPVRADLPAGKGLAPLDEQLPQGVGDVGLRLDVEDPAGVVGVQR